MDYKYTDDERSLFYAQPNATANMEYWCKFDILSFDALTALSLNKDPQFVQISKIQRVAHPNLPFTTTYMNQYALIEQAPIFPVLRGDRISVSKFFDWAMSVALTLPPKMIELLNMRKIKTEEEKSPLIQNESKPNEWPAGGEVAEMNADKAIAIMAWLLSEKGKQYSISGRPNSETIAAAVNERAIQYFGEEASQFKSFQKRLGKALNLLSDEESSDL